MSFIGRLSDRAALEAARLDVADFVSTSEPIQRSRLLRLMVEADALLLPSLHDTDRNALPMKLFEYIGAQRPIIVFGPGDHLAARLVAENGFGLVLTDEASLERCLRDLVDGDGILPPAPSKAGSVQPRDDPRRACERRGRVLAGRGPGAPPAVDRP